MALNPLPIGDNSQIPGAWAEVYSPDQLIAGGQILVSDSVTITGGLLLPRGSVLGQVVDGTVGPAVAGSNTGTGAITSPAAGGTARVGTYTVRMSSATTFTVIDPIGNLLAGGNALGAYNDQQLSFSIAAGGTAFVAGDTFTIAVGAGSGSYRLATAAATDGSQNPVAILATTTDATGGDVIGGIYIAGEFNINAVSFGAGVNGGTAKAPLAVRGIYLKTSVSAADPT